MAGDAVKKLAQLSSGKEQQLRDRAVHLMAPLIPHATLTHSEPELLGV